MTDSGLADWHQLYLAARRESDPDKLPQRVGTAEHAMRLRMALQADPDGPEGQALKRALTSLQSLKAEPSAAQSPTANPGKAAAAVPRATAADADGPEGRALRRALSSSHSPTATQITPQAPTVNESKAPAAVPPQPTVQPKQRNWKKVGAWVGLTALLSFGSGWAVARRTRVKPQIQITEQYEAASSQAPPAADLAGVANEPAPGTGAGPAVAATRSTTGNSRDSAERAAPAAPPISASSVRASDSGANASYGNTTGGNTTVDVFGTPAPKQRPDSAAPSAKSGESESAALDQAKPASTPAELPPPIPIPSVQQQAQSQSPAQIPVLQPAEPQSPPQALPPPQPLPPQTPSGSVSVSYGAYPSIHVPADVKAKAAASGASLKIGQLVNRVEPQYPDEAARQHVEGTVKLHALVGADGTVQDVQVLDGPPLLVPAAVSAVRQWRYNRTLLGDQPIETGQDISVAFRIGTSK